MDSYPLPPVSGYSRYPWKRALTLLLLAAGALYFMWRVHDVLPPFLIAFCLAALLDPVVSKMQRRGVSRGRAVASIYGLVFALIVLAGLAVVPPALNQVDSLTHNVNGYINVLTTKSDQIYARYQPFLDKIGIKQNPVGAHSDVVSSATSAALGTVKDTVIGLAGRVIWLIIIPLSLFYFLLDFRSIRGRLVAFLPAGSRDSATTMIEEIVEIFGQYFRSLAIVCCLYGATAVVLFYWMGLRYGLFLGIAAGILYAVPYVGPAVTIISTLVIALTMNPVHLVPTPIVLQPGVYAGIMVCLFIAMHVSFDYGITPKVVGGSVGLHPLVNIFALMSGATLFGVWGMLLAVPVAASVQMLLIYFFPRLAERPAQPTAVLAAGPASDDMVVR